jgi:hypothetical protein
MRDPQLTRRWIVPLTLELANAYVAAHHRHHGPVRGHRFSLGLIGEGGLRGVVIVGWPVARLPDDGLSAEVTRLCTDGSPNAASALYAAARRVAREMGFLRIVTYTLADEPGTSLRAAGWRCVGEADGGSWDTPSRRREDDHPTGPKVRWQVEFAGAWPGMAR